MEEKHAIEVTDLVISYQNLKKTSIKKNLLHFNRQLPPALRVKGPRQLRCQLLQPRVGVPAVVGRGTR